MNNNLKKKLTDIYNFAPFVFLNNNVSMPYNTDFLKNVNPNYNDNTFKLFDENKLKNIFFSSDNVELIQNKLKE